MRKAPATGASLSERGEQCEKERAEAFFLGERRRRRRVLDVPAADLQEEMAEQRFSVFDSSDEDGGAQRTSPRAERAIQQSAMREQLSNLRGLWSRPRISFGPLVVLVATETVGSFRGEVDRDFG